jgi:CO/xanthine dehydrogenase FAD-binding subunit
MTTQPREYLRPEDWPSALAALSRPDRSARPLVTAPRLPAEPFAGVDAVVDLSRLNLASIQQTERAVELGALVPLQDLVELNWQTDPAANVLAEAAHLAAHHGLRHLASVGGVLYARTGPPEVLLALLALEAVVVLRSAGEVAAETGRETPLADFLAQENPATGEVAVAVRFARSPAHSGGGLERVARTPRDEAIVAAAAVVELEGGVCKRARVSLAGTGVAPRRVPTAEALLEGQALSPARIQAAAEAAQAELTFSSDLRASGAYRQAMVVVVARRSLASAWQRASA